MARKQLESGAVGVFCESMAVMLDAGIQTEEAASLLAESTNDAAFQNACQATYEGLIERKTLSDAMQASNAFPAFAVSMVRTGEESGRLQSTLAAVARSYREEDRLLSKLHGSVAFPVALFALVSVILAFLLAVVMPVFLSTYQQVTGGLESGAFGIVNVALAVGWAALGLALLGTVVTLVVAVATKSQRNLHALERMLDLLPITQDAAHQLALSRFTTALSSYVAAGIPADQALAQAGGVVGHTGLKERVNAAIADVSRLEDAKSLSDALQDNDVFGAVYARMVRVGDVSGRLEDVLDQMGDVFFEDALVQMDESIDRIEPVLAALLTVVVGAALIAVMIPLIGILGSVG